MERKECRLKSMQLVDLLVHSPTLKRGRTRTSRMVNLKRRSSERLNRRKTTLRKTWKIVISFLRLRKLNLLALSTVTTFAVELILATSNAVLKSFLSALFRRSRNNVNATPRLLPAKLALPLPSSPLSATPSSRNVLITPTLRKDLLVRALGLLLQIVQTGTGSPGLMSMLKHFKPVRLTTNKPFQSS